MRTHAQIIADAGGYQGLADKLGLERERLRFWSKRESIPAEHWAAVAAAEIASLEELAEAVAVRRIEATTQGEAA